MCHRQFWFGRPVLDFVTIEPYFLHLIIVVFTVLHSIFNYLEFFVAFEGLIFEQSFSLFFFGGGGGGVIIDMLIGDRCELSSG